MSQTLKGSESTLLFITIPHSSTLWHITAKIDYNEKRDNSARSSFHWQLLKCRMVIFSLNEVLSCPSPHTHSEIHVIISKIDFEHGQLQILLAKLNMKLLGPIAVNPSIFESCLQYTINARLAPLWNPFGSALAMGRDFLSSKGSFAAIHVEYKIRDTVLTVCTRTSFVQTPHMTMSYLGFTPEILDRAWSKGNVISEVDLTGQWVYVLPSLKKGRIMAIWKSIPPSCPYKNYKEIRRHWKNAYGYRLPEQDTHMLFFEIYFRPLGSTFFTYPDVCVRPFYPRRCHTQNKETDISDIFLNDVDAKLPTVCGSPFVVSQKKARTTTDILPVTQIELDGEVNHQFLDSIVNDNTITPINNVDYVSSSSNLISLCTPTQKIVGVNYNLSSMERDIRISDHTFHSEFLKVDENQDINKSQNTILKQTNNLRNKPNNSRKQMPPIFIPYSVPSKVEVPKVLPFVPMFNKKQINSGTKYDTPSDKNFTRQEVIETASSCKINVLAESEESKIDKFNSVDTALFVNPAKFVPLFNMNKNKVILKEMKETSLINNNKIGVNLPVNEKAAKKENEQQVLKNIKKPPARPKAEAPELFTKNLLSGSQKLELATVASLRNWLKSQGINTTSKFKKGDLIEKALEVLRNLQTTSSTS